MRLFHVASSQILRGLAARHLEDDIAPAAVIPQFGLANRTPCNFHVVKNSIPHSSNSSWTYGSWSLYYTFAHSSFRPSRRRAWIQGPLCRTAASSNFSPNNRSFSVRAAADSLGCPRLLSGKTGSAPQSFAFRYGDSSSLTADIARGLQSADTLTPGAPTP